MKRIAIATALFLAGMVPALADGDATKGEDVFRKKCKSCHDVDEGKNKVGPTLKGIVGRPVASIEGFKYSDDMLAKGQEGKVWDKATLTAYPPDPKAFAPKTKMTFAGLKKAEEVADLVAFLKTKTN